MTKLRHVQGGFNFKGPVPSDFTWDQASKIPVVPMTIVEPPAHCPVCNKSIIRKKYDWMDIEKGGQFMVITYECPDKHGAFVDWA